jgi:hypothetical protein
VTTLVLSGNSPIRIEEPTWSFRYDGKQPWRVEEPLTSAQIAADFQSDLARFQPADIVEVSFSDELVPVYFDGARRSIVHAYQDPAEYWFDSRDGSPLKAKVMTGTIAWYRDHADARWRFEDPQGNVFAEGKLPLNGQYHEIVAVVPTAGLYRMAFNDSGAGWRIQVEPDQLATLDVQRGRRYLHQGWMRDTFIYVPKGTKTLHYFWAGNPHNLFGPSNQPIHRTKSSGAFVNVRVPAGLDGTVWRINQATPGELWFFNAPNLLNGSPGVMLLPRELVERDGLAIWTND